jgi:hypothetical protein
MRDPVLIAAVLEELEYFDGKNERDKKRKVHDEEYMKDNPKIAGQKNNKSKVLSVVGDPL